MEGRRMLSKLVQSPLVVGLVISLLVFVGLLGLRLAGSFEALELAVYDWYLRLRPDAPADGVSSSLRSPKMTYASRAPGPYPMPQ